jgi:hypothetical protein
MEYFSDISESCDCDYVCGTKLELQKKPTEK